MTYYELWKSLWWRHNDHDSVSNHQPHECLLNRLFRRRSKKTSKLRVTGLCVGNSPGPVNSPHKGPVTRKMFPFDDVIMVHANLLVYTKTPWHENPFCITGPLSGNLRVIGGFPHKGQLLWTNNLVAGDLTHHDPHWDLNKICRRQIIFSHGKFCILVVKSTTENKRSSISQLRRHWCTVS